MLNLNKYELNYKIKNSLILTIYKGSQIFNIRQKYRKLNMLFKIYSKLVGFPKKERPKSPSLLPHTFRHFYILTFVLCSKYM